jgi:hypothetical protein
MCRAYSSAVVYLLHLQCGHGVVIIITTAARGCTFGDVLTGLSCVGYGLSREV